MQDNADLSQKIKIRQDAISLLGRKPKKVIDAFSGEGVIAKMLWSVVADEVICIEKDVAKAKKNPLNPIISDNMSCADLMIGADIVDCDAYGLSMPLIELVPSGVVIVFTDGTPHKARNVYSAHKRFKQDFERLLKDGYFILSEASNVYYGIGIRK